jgi:hypothetical protein
MAHLSSVILLGKLTRGKRSARRLGGMVIAAATAVRGNRESLTDTRQLGVLGSMEPLV